MSEDTELREIGEASDDGQLQTSGHIERTILHQMVSDDYQRYTPTTVSDVLHDITSVIERGGYANVGPNGAAGATVRKSSIRRTFKQLHEKGLVQRVEELTDAEVREPQYDLGTLDSDGESDDPTAYSRTSDDARVTDWILTDDGRREVERLDAQYAEKLDELAARYGRPSGETTARIDV